MGWLSVILFVKLMVGAVLCLDNGLARTPPMGWLSWERFLCNINCADDPKNCISEQLYKDMAERLVQDGYKDVGYEYVNIDDCWMASSRDSSGKLQADPQRFPSGIKALADYVHGLGLKLGIYQDCGTKTCAGYPGAQGYFDIDAQTYAEWGVDMLKLDGCNADPKAMDQVYPEMTAALNKTGRPIVYSCEWPLYQRGSHIEPDYQKIAQYCNLWRNYNDVADSWDSVKSIVTFYNSMQDQLVPVSGPGQWNDPDMLIIGNFGLSLDQAKTQMALWAIYASPLFMSNDLRDIRDEFKAILQNKDIIAINQDPLGHMGKKISEAGNIQFYTRPVAPVVNDQSSYAVALVNRNEIGGPVLVKLNLSMLQLNNPKGYHVRDLYTGEDKGILKMTDSLQLLVNPTGVVMIKTEAQG